MAQYKVPQDVEAEDKLLGPFTFRQFIYLLIIAALIGFAVVLFNVMPTAVAAIVSVFLAFPIVVLAALALPIKKDQPMETYLGAVVTYHLKTKVRPWVPGQPETTIEITAPKIVEEDRTNGLSQEEASHRLSFLANLVDTEGYAIKGNTNSSLQDDVYAEAQAQRDIFELPQNSNLDTAIQASANNRHQQLVDQMRAAIANNTELQSQNAAITSHVKPEPVPSSPNIAGTDEYQANPQPQPVAQVPQAAPAPQIPQAPQVPQEQAPNLPPADFQVPQYYDAPQNNIIAQPVSMPAPETTPASIQTTPVASIPVPAPAPQATPEMPAEQPKNQAKPIDFSKYKNVPTKKKSTSLADAGEIDDYQAPVAAPVVAETTEAPSQPQSSVIVAADMPVEAVFVPEPTNPYAMPSLEEIETEELTDAQKAARAATNAALSKAGVANVEDAAAEQADAAAEDIPDLDDDDEPDANMIELANNTDFSVETIAKQANRVKENQQNGEVYISLH